MVGLPAMSILRSPLLDGVRHGFSTRVGGVSTGRYATLNLGFKWGDDAAHVAENRRRFAADGGFELDRLATVHQVHGADCVIADGLSAEELAASDADAIVAKETGRA